MAQTQPAPANGAPPAAAAPAGGSPPLGSSPPFGSSPLVGGSPPFGSSPSAGAAAAKPPRPRPAIKQASLVTAATAAVPPPPAARHPPSGSSHAMPPPIESEGPLTFSSPFATAQELRQGAAAAAHHPQQPPSGEPRPPGVLRTGSGLASGAPGSGALGEQPARLRRTVSWSDVENRAPLAQVVEYEPSENHSTHSEDEWASHSSGCICCIQ